MKRARSAWNRCSAQYGIYASQGQLYKPVDSENLPVSTKKPRTARSWKKGSPRRAPWHRFTAAGTAYANYGVPMIPFFIYYSMFGYQRVGDMVWAFADSRGKGFLMGGTAGRTTLSGEGLQHQDGHSLGSSAPCPPARIYDPAYAYEIAVIIQDGIRRMYQEIEDRFYYLTVYNENYAQPPMPEGVAKASCAGFIDTRPPESGNAASAAFRQRAYSE